MKRLWASLGKLAKFLSLILGHKGLIPDVTWVTPELAVGGGFYRWQVGELRARGVQSIVDLRLEDRHNEVVLTQHGMNLLHLPVLDYGAPSQEQLLRGTRWVQGQLAQGRKVLINCRRGRGRSVTMLCAVLMTQGYSLDEAYARIRRKRWFASLNHSQRRALEEFADILGRPENAAASMRVPQTH